MAGPIDVAFVEIIPDLKNFDKEVTRGIKKSLAEVEVSAAASASELENSFDDAMRDISKEARITRKVLERELSNIEVDVKIKKDAVGGLRDERGSFLLEGAILGEKAAEGIGEGIFSGVGAIQKGFDEVFSGVAANIKPAVIGLGAVIGTTLVGALGPAVIALAATLPSAIATAVGAIGTLKLGFSGLSEAFKNIGDIEKFNEAIAKLTPSARAFAIEVRNLVPAFNELKQAAQESLFAGFQGQLTAISNTLAGPLENGLIEVGLAFNEIGLSISKFLQSSSGVQLVNSLFESTTKVLRSIAPAIEPLATGISNLITSSLPFITELTDAFSGFLSSIGGKLTKATKDGSLNKFFSDALDTLKLLKSALAPVGTFFKSIFTAAAPAGVGTLQVLRDVGTEIGKLLARKEVIDAIKLAFGSFVVALRLALIVLKFINAEFDIAEKVVKNLGKAVSNVGTFFSNLATNAKRTASNISQAFKEAAENIKKAFNNVLTFFQNLVKNIKDAFNNLKAFFENLWKNISNGIETAFNKVVKFFKELPQKIFKALTTPSFATVLGEALVSPIVGVINLIKAAFKGIDAIGTFFSDLWEKVRINTVNAFNNVITFLTELPPRILAAFLGLVESVTTFFVNLWESVRVNTVNAFNNIITFLTELPGKILAVLSSLLTSLGEFFTSVWENVRTATVNGIQRVVDFVASAPGKILALGGKFLDAGKTIIKKFFDGLSAVGGFAGRVGDAIANALKSALNFAIDVANAGINAISRALPGFDLPNIPRVAAGGITTGATTAIIGEAGPEAVIPLSGSRGRDVLRQLAQAGGQAVTFAAGAIAISFNGVVPSSSEATRTGEAVGNGIAAALARRDTRVQIRAV